MSITSYATLLTAVATWLKRDDLTDVIPDFVMLGEQRIYRDLRVRAMEASLSSAIASGVVAVPSGYVALKNAYIDGTPVGPLVRKDAEWIYHRYPTRSADGKPKYIGRDVSNFVFGPYPDSTYTVKATYYKRLDALSDSNTSNWLITDAPDLLLFAALCEAEPYMESDARIPIWENKYEQRRNQIQLADDAEEFSGSPLSASVR